MSQMTNGASGTSVTRRCVILVLRRLRCRIRYLAMLLLASASTTAMGASVDFEEFGLEPGTQIDFAKGETWFSGGFAFTPGPIPDSNESHVANAVEFFGFNGTHIGVWHHDMVMTRADGRPFDLVSFDFSGFPIDNEVSFIVIAQPGDVVAAFSPDGLVDGPGGVQDFETFILPSGFTNITNATWVHTGDGTVAGVFAVDNIVVPGPATLSLLVFAVLGVTRRRRRPRWMMAQSGSPPMQSPEQ